MAKVSDYTLVIPKNASFNEKRAASFIRQYIRLITGKTVPLVTDETTPVQWEIAIGKTNREQLDEMDFSRDREKVWEYLLQSRGGRLYITGLGLPPQEQPPYNTAYRLMDDGAIGTVFGAYHFVEKILGFDFVYDTYDVYPEKPNVQIPGGYSYRLTAEKLEKQLPKKIEGTAMYSIPGCKILNWNMSCFLFRTRQGKLVVIDGGRDTEEDAEHILKCLETLSGGEKPVVSAWLFTHLHADHYGVPELLCTCPELAERVQVEHFYCNFLTEEFYTTLAKERNPRYAQARETLLNMGNTLGAQVHTVEVGDLIQVDELSFEVLRVPSLEQAADMNMNDSSVVYKLTHDSGQTILFLADAEWVCSNDLMKLPPEKLKSDFVQVGHHGCGNVSRQCYEAIDADFYLFQICDRFWYGDNAEGLNTHNTGVLRTRSFIREMGKQPENIFRDGHGILTFPLPFRKFD